jgi:hypothetical protein
MYEEVERVPSIKEKYMFCMHIFMKFTSVFIFNQHNTENIMLYKEKACNIIDNNGAIFCLKQFWNVMYLRKCI